MIAPLLAAVALLSAPAAAPPAGPCVTKDEGADLGLVLTADALAATAQVCLPRLPETAFLRSTAGTAYMNRLREAAEARRANALSTFTRISAGHLPAGVTPELVMSGMTSQASRAAMSGFVNDTACAEANRMIEALSPLPPANIATFLSAFTGMTLAVLPNFFAADRRPGMPPNATPSRIGPFCPA